MEPTLKLRFVERLHPHMAHQTVRVLQQWWEQKGMTVNLGWGGNIPLGEVKGEWRDVQLEKETTCV
jgi:hypothetical protein